MDALARAYPESQAVRCAAALAEAAEATIAERPTIDFGMAALERALGAPAGTALGLFALGRTVGWVAHAIEEYALGRLIRPRATYVGPDPAP